MGRKLIYPIAWCLCHCAMVSAQDVFISPVFEVLEQERSSPRMMGASLAFRFPFGADRYVFEVMPGILQSEWMDLPDAYERRDKRVGGSIAFLRTQRLNAFSVDYGLVAGWHRRTISLHHHSASEVLAYQTLGAGMQVALRYSRSPVVQPILSLSPYYEHPLDDVDPELSSLAPAQGLWGVVVRLGIVLGLPTPAGSQAP